tara:strand:+ start:244 stop:666 length:423 start_codon:yes stop_codon:yes gene_type:complete
MKTKLVTLFIFFLALTACAGTGTKSNSYIPELESNGSGQVFILRDSGFAGIASVFTVELNNISIGKLGNKEILTSQANNGANTLSVKVTGIQGLGLNEPYYTFNATMNENYYFIIRLNVGLLTNKLEIVEVTESSFRQAR